MSGPFSHSLHLSSAIEEPMVPQKQGIVSILGSDQTEISSVPFKAGASLRRTLSADMSSKKWLNQQGFSSLKKIASSNLISTINDSSSEDGEGDEDEKPGLFDIWSSIVSQKEESAPLISPPYIHPLVKRSASCLSKKSLEICTESLGSETGSDSFSASSYPPSESGGEIMEEEEINKEEESPPHQLPASFDEDEPRVLKYNSYVDVVGRKPAAAEYRSFPPPIPSLSCKDGGAVVRMRTHRGNGRIVLEAVSVASQNNFLAQRQDGRLVLTFANTKTESSKEEGAKEVEELEEVFDESFEEENTGSEIDGDEEEEEEEEEETEENRWCEMEAPKLIPSGAMNVHRLALMMNKPIWLAKSNPTWPKNFDQIVQFGEEKEEITTPTPLALAQSLPPHPPVSRLIPSQAPSTVAAAATLNGYNHYWRRSSNYQPMSKAAADQVLINHPLAHHPQQSPPVKNLMPNDNHHHQQQRLVVPFSKGCKELRRSLLFWEPYCIAT